MHARNIAGSLAVAALVALSGCTEPNGHSPSANGNGQAEDVKVVRIEAGPEAAEQAQEALITVKPGEVVEFGEGTFEFKNQLSLNGIDDVTIRGQGIDKTILNFKGLQAGTGGEGILVKANGCQIESLTVVDSPSDAIKVDGADGITFRKVKVDWSAGPRTENGAYGLYPVQSKNVLIEECEVYCASDAGLYVGQSENIIVRRCKAERNVAGIEIENSVGADVYENIATNNTGGILVFSLPDLPKIQNGKQCRVFDNQVVANNHPNFGKEGNIVSEIPPGSGVIIMANDDVEIFRNQIKDNQTANVSVISYVATGREYKDKAVYDPFPEAIYIHDNTFVGGGDKPEGALSAAVAPLLGGKLPDIVYDGLVNPAKATDGALPKELGVYAKNNADADFVNLDFANLGTDKHAFITVAEGELAPLPPITIEGVE